MAVASGLSAANLYYLQPLLADVADELRVSSREMGIVAALFQLGYALGLFLFVPLGDVVERRRLIVTLLGTVTFALLGVALSPTVPWLAGASLAVGALSVAPQLLVPFAASLVPVAERGRAIGLVMSGLLIGILLSRTVSGFVGTHLGWRAMYGMAAGLMVALAAVLAACLPRGEPLAARMPYTALLRSLGPLLRDQPVLRESCWFGATAFGAFSAFWTTLAFFLAGPPYQYGADVVGLFGLLGAAGALAAAMAGRLGDRAGPRSVIGLGLGMALLAFFCLWSGTTHLAGLLAGVVLLDIGVQACHVSNQSRIFRLPADAHSRLNTVYMVFYFLGGSAGSVLGTHGWEWRGWTGVCGVGAALVLAGLAVHAGPVLGRRLSGVRL
jgi:predicted MFS family arabinose efflux permease